jgi:hypothetical protein
MDTPSNETIAIAICVLVIIWLVIHCYSVKVYRFSRPTCPYCVSSQAEWDSFKMSCWYRMIRPIDVNMDNVPNDADLAELVGNMAVTGVPTIIKVHWDGRRYLYAGDRSASDLLLWANGSK